jgi:hypothetical protein
MTRTRSALAGAAMAAALAAGLAASVPARAEAASLIIKQNQTHKHWDLGLLMHFPWLGGIGTGLRLGIPVAPAGFSSAINDQVKLEVGFSFRHWWPRWYWYRCDPARDPWCDPDGFFGFSIPLLMRWDFFVVKPVTLYLTFGLEINIIPAQWWVHERHYISFLLYPVIPSFSFGLLFNVHERVSIRTSFALTGFNLGVEFRL